MRSLEVFAGFIFFTVAFLFVVNGFGMQVKSSIHQIYQMLHVICAVLCVGFGCLMIKQPAIKEVYED
tara:strand:+ start:1673 stop:1873 length:201 start_codon:yes stop_codon:yes gene_type:complete